MNKKCALIKSLLQGDIINVSNSIRLTGYSNPAREIPREIEKPFKVIISRVKVETKDQFGNYVTYHDYRLNPLLRCNHEGIKEMHKYLLTEGAYQKTGARTDKELRQMNIADHTAKIIEQNNQSIQPNLFSL